MFKQLSVTRPTARPVMPIDNHFMQVAVAMPAELMPVLKDRMFTVLMQKLYDVHPSHDVSYKDLISLEKLFEQEMLDERHNLILNGLYYGFLKRFCQAERVEVGRRRNPITRLTNERYWTLLGELLESMIRPTVIVELSFYARL